MVDNPFSLPAAARTEAQSLISVEQQRAIAEVQAQLIIARANPRDARQCVDLILQDCTRVTLAETALYEYARGGTEISGPSIRLMETIARRWGNIASAVKEVSRRDGYSECVAYAWDLESNYRDERQFQVRHWRDRKGGGGYRMTDERDIYEAIANQGQRRKRAALQAVIPGDVIEAAVEQCEATLKIEADTSPEALKKLVEAFAQFNISKEQIEVRCQRRMEAIRPAQIVQLRKIWASLRDEMSQPADWFEIAAPPTAQAPPATGNEALRERLAQGSPQKPEERGPALDASEPTASEDASSAAPAEAADLSPGVAPPDGTAVRRQAEPVGAALSAADRPREAGEEEQPAAPEGDDVIPLILPARLHRGWDWPGYANQLIEAGCRLPPDQIGQFRVLNASQLNNLRIRHKEQWDRVQQALAEHEREGA